MSDEPSAAEKPLDPVSALQHNRMLRGLYWIQQLCLVWAVCAVWPAHGPGHLAVPPLVAIWAFLLTPGVAVPVIRVLPAGWWRVPEGERVLHHFLGVQTFGWLLERSGWNRRHIYPAWGGPLTRGRLSFRAMAARAGGGAHAACFALHLLLATVALLTRYPWGAVWILLPGVVIPLLDRYGSSSASL